MIPSSVFALSPRSAHFGHVGLGESFQVSPPDEPPVGYLFCWQLSVPQQLLDRHGMDAKNFGCLHARDVSISEVHNDKPINLYT